MHVTIKYCRPCGYLAYAEQLARRLEAEGVETRLVPGNLGVFKVWVDEELVFDKRSTNGMLGKLGFGKLPSEETLLFEIRRKGSNSVAQADEKLQLSE